MLTSSLRVTLHVCAAELTCFPVLFSSLLLPQVRIEQVLMSSPPPLLCFRLSQLLAFYLGTVEGLLGAGSQLAGAALFLS